MNKRLTEELIDMSSKCSTGHLSRLINVLQGFETELKVKVQINIKDEIYAKIKYIIEKNIINEENSDEIMEDMISEEKIIYINYVKKLISKNIKDIIDEYNNISDKENIITIIIECLNKYTNTTNKFYF